MGLLASEQGSVLEVEGGVVEGRAEVGGDAWPRGSSEGDLVGELLGTAAVGIADPAHAGPMPAGKFLGMGRPADPAAEDRDGDFVEWRRPCRGVIGPGRAPPSPLPRTCRQGRAAGDSLTPREPLAGHRIPL